MNAAAKPDIAGQASFTNNKRAIARLGLSIFLPLALLTVMLAAIFHQSRLDRERFAHTSKELQRVLKREEVAAYRIKAVVSDLQYLADETDLHIQETSHSDNVRFLANELRLFAKRKHVYREVCLLDASGREIVSVNQDNADQITFPKDGVHEPETGLPKEIFRLGKGEIYISPILQPSPEMPFHAMVFATPVVGKDGKRLATALIKYDAAQLLRELRTATPAAPGNDMLLGVDGSWIYTFEETGNGLEEAMTAGRRFPELFPDAWRAIRAGESGRVQTAKGLFTYTTVYPLLEGMEEIRGPKDGRQQELILPRAAPDAWKIVSFVPNEVESAETSQLLHTLLPFYGGFLLLLGAGSWLWAGKSVRHREAEARLMEERLVRIQITRGAELARVTLQSIGDGVITTDINGRVAYLNPVAERLTGWNNAEAQGMVFAQVCRIVHETTRGAVECPVQKALREGAVAELSSGALLIRRDGEELAIQDTAAPIRDPEGQIVGAVLVIQDVTARRESERQLKRYNEELQQLVREREQANQRLRQSEERFRKAFSASPDIMTLSRLSDGLIIDVNQAFVELSGYQRDEAVGRTSLELGLWADPDERSQVFRELLSKGSIHDREIYCRTKSGEIRLLLISAELLEIDDKPSILMVSRDITDRKHMEESLREREAHLRAIVDGVIDGIITIDARGIVETFNPAACRIFGYEAKDVVGRNVSMLMPEPERGEHDGYIRQYLNSGKAKIIGIGREVTGLRKGGGLFPIELAVSEVRLGDKRHFIGILRDITERKEVEQRLAFLAQYDQLTGLANRILFHDHLRQALARAKRNGRKVAVMFLDLDRFKAINDTLGHEVGDRLLQEVARRLRDCVRDSDVVARLGGDEFTVIMEGIDQEADAAHAAEAILNTMKLPVKVNGRELAVTMSIGIALYPDSGDDADTLLRHADLAMYQIKECGRNAYQVYRPETAARRSCAEIIKLTPE